MDLDPYAELGVPRDATRDMIKRARKRKARELHPDRQHGDGEKMARCNLAHDILVDPARRAQWERTREHRVTTEEEEACKLIREGFHSHLMQALQKRRNPGNVPFRVGRAIQDSVTAAAAMFDRLDHDECYLRARLDDCETSDATNFWRTLVESQLAGVAEKRAVLQREVRVHMLALKILKRYRSRVHDDGRGLPPAVRADLMEELRGRERRAAAMRGDR